MSVFSFFLSILYLFPWYVALVLFPSLLIRLVKRKIVNQFIFDNFTKNKYLNHVLYSLEEEILFRYFPYAYFGFPGLVVGSIIWAVLHIYNRGYTKQEKLLYLAYYLSSAIFYIYAFTINIVAPVFYHVMHNLLVDYLEEAYFKKLQKEVSKSKFIKTESNPKPVSKTVEIKPVQFKIPTILKYVRTTENYTYYETEQPPQFKYTKLKL